MGAVIVLFIGLILLGITMSIIGSDNKMAGLQTAGLTLMVVSGVSLGVFLGESLDREFKQPITPTIHIECENGKCDTTYIYKFEEKK